MIFKTILKALGRTLPIIGDVITNVESENGTKIGTINVVEVGYMILRIIILIAFIKGMLNADEISSFFNAVK